MTEQGLRPSLTKVFNQRVRDNVSGGLILFIIVVVAQGVADLLSGSGIAQIVKSIYASFTLGVWGLLALGTMFVVHRMLPTPTIGFPERDEEHNRIYVNDEPHSWVYLTWRCVVISGLIMVLAVYAVAKTLDYVDITLQRERSGIPVVCRVGQDCQSERAIDVLQGCVSKAAVWKEEQRRSRPDIGPARSVILDYVRVCVIEEGYGVDPCETGSKGCFR